MRSSIAYAVAIAAPLASAGLLTAQNGGACIINQCDFDIPLNNVPAMKDGVENAESEQKTLSANGGRFDTPYVQLLSGGGWSMKLDPLKDGNLMQFEYTFMPDGQIWTDMSYVGVPEEVYNKFPSFGIQAEGAKFSNKFYTAWNDDANGMQTPIGSGTSVTLVLCTGGSSGGNSAPATYAPAPTTTPAPVPTTLQTSAAPIISVKKAAVDTTQAPAPTTPATTQAPPAPTTTPAPAVVAVPADSDAVVVTEFETKIVTAVVTEVTNQRRKRHAHGHARHGHPQ